MAPAGPEFTRRSTVRMYGAAAGRCTCVPVCLCTGVRVRPAAAGIHCGLGRSARTRRQVVADGGCTPMRSAVRRMVWLRACAAV